MNEHSSTPTIPSCTIGLDLSDKSVEFCILDEGCHITARGSFPLNRRELGKRFGAIAGARIALETSTQSAWISDLLTSFGHEVIVATSRELRSISGSARKSDTRDAEQLARLARVDPKLLRPVRHRRPERRLDLLVVRTRALLVESRTRLLVGARHFAKMFGQRIPSCESSNFAARATAALRPELRAVLGVLLTQIEALSEAICRCDEQIEALAAKLPETGVLRQVKGVGTLTALTYVLTLDDPSRFVHSRDVGPFLGLTPKRNQSGESDPQLGISKCGDHYLRALLVQCAHHILGRWGAPSALRDWGLQHAAGSRRAKKKAVVAVARKLAVLLHRLWKDQTTYQPYPAPVPQCT